MSKASALFTLAEPLLRQSRKNGWTPEETWQLLCERWLKDAGEEYTAHLPLRKRSAVRKQMGRMREYNPKAMDVMLVTPERKRKMLADMIRKLATADGRRQALDDMQLSDDEPAHNDSADTNSPEKVVAKGTGSVHDSRQHSLRSTWHASVRSRPKKLRPIAPHMFLPNTDASLRWCSVASRRRQLCYVTTVVLSSTICARSCPPSPKRTGRWPRTLRVRSNPPPPTVPLRHARALHAM